MVLYCVNLKDRKFEFFDASGGKFTPLLQKLCEHVVNFVTQYIDVVLQLNYNWGDFRWRQVTSINSHEDTHGGIVCLKFCELWEGKLLTVWKRTWRGQTYLRSRSAQMVQKTIEDPSNLQLQEMTGKAMDMQEGLLRGYTQVSHQ
ncbi:unnamed protein product [Linum trigynum]|uniref:Uncharacterized protein n=1 Tax=Linum trigynum TaxID=586398 RepID=A0AAV2GC98_9ROSI